MFTLTFCLSDGEGFSCQSFKGETRQDATDEYIMWNSQENFDFRFPPRALEELLGANDILTLATPEFSSTFQFTKDPS